MSIQFTARYFWDRFNTQAEEQWLIALAEHNLPADYQEEEYSELMSWIDEGIVTDTGYDPSAGIDWVAIAYDPQ